MVNGQEALRQQQQALRQPRRTSLQIQQESLRRGVSIERVRAERQQAQEETRIRGEIVKEQRSQAKQVDSILKQVGTIQQLENLINQIPPNIKQFIKINPQSVRLDLTNRINNVQNTIEERQRQLAELINDRRVSIQKGDTSTARRQDTQISGAREEIGFLQGVIPRLQQGEILSTSQIFSLGRNISSAETSKRRKIEEQFSVLAEKLGSREELSQIFRTQKITQIQAEKLGLVTRQAVSPIQQQITTPTLPVFIDPITGERIFESISPEIARQQGLIEGRSVTFEEFKEQTKPKVVNLNNIPKDFKDVFRTESQQKQRDVRDIFGSISGQGGVDFSKSTGVGGKGGVDIGGGGLGQILPEQKLGVQIGGLDLTRPTPEVKTLKQVGQDFKQLGGDI